MEDLTKAELKELDNILADPDAESADHFDTLCRAGVYLARCLIKRAMKVAK